MQDAVGSGTVQKPDYVITLVHGTILFSQSLIRRRGAPAQSRLMDLVALLLGAVYYAVDRVCARLRRIDPPPDALNWTRPHSPFRDTLERDLGRPVVFREFRWSGHNSHLDRLVAAEHLREHLRTVSADYPAARQVVIGHSHGGNVVLYALRDPDIRQRVAAVVTLATPFLKVRAQPTMVPWLVLGISVILLLAVAPGLAALAAAGAGWLAADWIEPLVGRPVAFGPMFLGAWSIGTFLFCILHFRELLVLALALTGDGAFRRRWGNVMRVASSLARRSSRLLDYQTRRVRRLTLPACTDMPILCLRAPNDEIGRFLKRVERWSRSPIALWQRFFGTLYVGFTLVLAGLFFTAYFSQPRLWADGMLEQIAGYLGRLYPAWRKKAEASSAVMLSSAGPSA
jgi:hypothetical protein